MVTTPIDGWDHWADVVTIALGGDTMLGRMVGEALLSRPPAEAWDVRLREVFGEADLAIVNLECCISERGQRWPAVGKPFFFRAPPVATDVLAEAGVRAVWLANNHALDYGPVALLDTFEHLERAGISWAGAGTDLAAARRGRTVMTAGVRIGLIGFADHPSDYAAGVDRPGIALIEPGELASAGPPAWLLSEIGRLRAECEVVIVGPHWGPNMRDRPVAHHPPVARALVAAGASALAGHSAHVCQPIELVDGAPVLYDLGDLLDDYAVDERSRNDLGMLALWTPGVRLEIVPLQLEYTRTRLAQGKEHRWIVQRLRQSSAERGLELRSDAGRLVLDL